MYHVSQGMNAFLDRSHHMYTTCADLAEVRRSETTVLEVSEEATVP